jgi:hypothetical protein
MEPFTLLIIIIGAIILIGLFWVLGKFFLHLLKHAIIAVIIAVVLLLVWYQPWNRPARNPNIGKHAYAANDDLYLGVVVGSAKDDQLGEVWIVKRPNGSPTKYRKSRVVLKDE